MFIDFCACLCLKSIDNVVLMRYSYIHYTTSTLERWRAGGRVYGE